MKKRALGKSGLEIAPLVFGGNVFGWTIDEATAFTLLDRFVDAGLNLIDTADVYSAWAPGNSGGESETIIGRWFKRSGKRDQVLIATKVGMNMGGGKQGLAKAYITKAVDESLRRLQTDRIDLYQAHQDDPSTALEESCEAFDSLIKAGKVRVIGASNYSAARLAEALETASRLGFARYRSLQPHYNLMEREGFEAELEPLCRREGLGVIPYYSLASGFLSGKYRAGIKAPSGARSAGVQKYMNERGFRVLKALDEVAAQVHATPAQVALAWLMHRPSITAPIASATSLPQLNELIKATDISLKPESVALLDTASAQPVGERV